MQIKPSQLREMTDEELILKKLTLKRELFDLRQQVKVGRVEKPHRIGQVKKEMARIETILNERKK